LSDPIVVGGTGGSGTRLVAELLQAAGVFMGDDLNYALDSAPVNRVDSCYLRGNPGLDELMREKLSEHLGGRFGIWGWKHTASYLTLPMWHCYFPDMYFVHVIRDGRDLAYAPHIALPVFGLVLGLNPGPSTLMALWASTNQACANYGERFVEGYYRVRYEDLCYNSIQTIKGMYEFLGLEGNAESARGLVRPSAGMGRWKGKGGVEEVEKIGEYALRRFGY
jgi:hypothetical protein